MTRPRPNLFSLISPPQPLLRRRGRDLSALCDSQGSSAGSYMCEGGAEYLLPKGWKNATPFDFRGVSSAYIFIGMRT